MNGVKRQPSLRGWLRSAKFRAGTPTTRASVRGKLMRVVLITTALALWVAGAAMLTYDLNVYRSSWASDLHTEAAILALSTGPALAFDDHDSAARDLAALRARPQVQVAALYTADGRLYASYARSGQASVPEHPPMTPGVRIEGERVQLVQRVDSRGEQLGFIYLRAQYDLAGRLTAYLGIFALVTLLSLGVAYIFSRRLQQTITRPLEAMTAVARGIIVGRDFSLRSAQITDDEIGVVVDAFNRMLDEVQARTRALERSERALRAADRRKDEFLATLAHELRNPLAPIRHAVKLLEANLPHEQQRQWAREVISRQVQRMALLLDDLLDVSRITRGRLDLKFDVVDLHALISTAAETARPLIEAKRQHLRIEKPPHPLFLRVDPLRLSQSLSNLLTNAAKYTDEGGDITVNVGASAEEIRMAVRDTGIGLDPAVIPELFEMFSQVESALERSEGGLGIGLALVKGLVSLHGGRVEASSAGPGKGSEFTIILPASLLVPDRSGEQRNSGATAAAAPRACRTILVADDNRDAADSLALVLEMEGHEVYTAHGGQEALDAARDHRPDVAILDIGMPGLSGYEVASAIRRETWGAPIYLLAVTGWGQVADKERARGAGFDEHLTKPVDPERIEKLIAARYWIAGGSADTSTVTSIDKRSSGSPM
jgi:signal transduction histidine kinase/ActR/RegA family two-component response regulator